MAALYLLKCHPCYTIVKLGTTLTCVKFQWHGTSNNYCFRNNFSYCWGCNVKLLQYFCYTYQCHTKYTRLLFWKKHYCSDNVVLQLTLRIMFFYRATLCVSAIGLLSVGRCTSVRHTCVFRQVKISSNFLFDLVGGFLNPSGFT